MPRCNTGTRDITQVWRQGSSRRASVSHTGAVPDLGQGLRRLHLLPQRSLHLVSQHLTQAVFGVGGGVFIPDCLSEQETTESGEHLMLHVKPEIIVCAPDRRSRI